MTEICTVFGDIEARLADYMIADGLANRIELRDFPKGARKTNENQVRARFAVQFRTGRSYRNFLRMCDRANHEAGLYHRVGQQ